MRGRKPTPDAIKALRGNPGKRRIGVALPQLGTEKMTCPRHLGKIARAEWHRMSKVLGKLGLLAATDRAALAAYCLAYGRWVEAETKIAEEGVVTKTVDGNSIQNPYLSIANKAFEQMTKLLSEFGMTPTSRTRIHVAAPTNVDPFEAMFHEKRG